MNAHELPRRSFLRHAGLAAAAAAWLPRAACAAPASSPSAGRRAFSLVLLGDLHFDRMTHHDMDWVRKTHPGDVSQIENYTRITGDTMPRLFAAVRRAIGQCAAPEGGGGAPAPVAMVVQVGDLVEGLCGRGDLAELQNTETVDALRAAGWGVPFLFSKGNHDITGPGAREAFDRVFLPFLTGERRRLQPGAGPVASANFSASWGSARFVFFDAYVPESLDWLEAEAGRRTEEHFIVVMHPPVVPYGARSTWHLYSSSKDQARRGRLLDVLGAQRAIVLGGHIHRYCALTRRTPKGAFGQLAVSSVVSRDEPKVREECGAYDEEQVKLEPRFSPANEAERRAVYRAEAPAVGNFSYADMPGFAVLRIDGPSVVAHIHAGTTGRLWRTVDLSALRG